MTLDLLKNVKRTLSCNNFFLADEMHHAFFPGGIENYIGRKAAT
jgi:hypothetical protein